MNFVLKIIKKTDFIERNMENIVFLFLFFLAFLTSFYNYLLFHSLTEIASVVVAIIIFILVLNAYKRIDNTFILIIGVSYLFVGIINLLHTLAYSGLSVFVDRSANLPTQLWLASRYLESLSFLFGLIFISKRIKFRYVFSLYFVISSLLLMSIFWWKNFPQAFDPVSGLTDFKIYSEYFLSTVFFVSLVFLYLKRRQIDRSVFKLLNYALALALLTELFFTLYISVFDYFNLLGHLLKLFSFYLIYLALVELSIRQPHRLLYRNLKKSEKKYADLFAHMSSGFALHKIITDEKGRAVDYSYIEANRAFGDLTGLDIEKISGKKVTELIPGIKDDPANWIERYGRVALQRENLKFEQYAKDFNRYYSISAYSPSPGFFATIFEDITREKNIDQAKSDFVSFVSHEFKTPLTSMSLNIELLKRIQKQSFSEEQEALLQDLQTSVAEMKDFISTLLNVSRIETGKIFVNKDPLDVGIQMNVLLSRVSSLIKKKGITVTRNYQRNIPIIFIDETAFDLIVNNILTNAIRYTPQGGKIEICLKADKDVLSLSIRDNGMGISQENKLLVFSKMFKSECRPQGGEMQNNGLGLFIAKSITDKQGIKLHFKSEQNKGTVFFVEFPWEKFREEKESGE